MTHYLPDPLLADATFLHLGDRFREGGYQFGWQSVAVVAGLALVIGLVLWLAARWMHLRERRIIHSPQKLLQQLYAAHGLSYRDRRLVDRLVRQHKLLDPAVLFVEPAWWDVEPLGTWWQSRQSEYHALRDRLFARS